MLWPSISGLKLHLGKEKRLCSQSPTGVAQHMPPNPALFQPYLRHIIKASSTSSFLQLPWSYLLSAHSVFPLPRWLPLTAPKCAPILNVISHHRVWNHSPADSFFQILEFYNPCSIPLDSECSWSRLAYPASSLEQCPHLLLLWKSICTTGTQTSRWICKKGVDIVLSSLWLIIYVTCTTTCLQTFAEERLHSKVYVRWLCGSVVRCADCSSGQPRSDCQHPHSGIQPSLYLQF